MYSPADRNAKTYRGQSSGALRDALSAISSDIPASTTFVTITSRRRSIASAAAPPTIGNTKTGTSWTRPSMPTAKTEPVIAKTWNGTTTATIESPK